MSLRKIGLKVATIAAVSGLMGTSIAAAEEYRIAVPLQGLTAEFMQLWVKGANEHPAVVDGTVNLTVFDGRLDALTQSNHFDTIITQQFDAVIFIPVDAEAGTEPARRALEAGIPVFGSNTLVSDPSVYQAYVGSNDVVAGEVVAQTIIDQLGERKNVVVLEGPIGHSAQIQRAEGIASVVAASEGVNVLAQRTANWSRAEALALMENWLTAYPGQIDGVIAQNDEMALGAIEALRARGVSTDDVPVAGIDGIGDALVAVQEGTMSTTLQDATGQAQGAIDLALRHLVGEGYEPRSPLWETYSDSLSWNGGTESTYMIPWVPVTLDNVEELLARRN
ncbi:MAG: substrate-binding domain-containing protein [Devosiaceae bacterium]|nr:substrate-binding domain-containing protein [Devosiaceae bacterium MH13]